jgi:cytochrome oxidase Cu insertion factor (SCO1/SenC/PrrC family)
MSLARPRMMIVLIAAIFAAPLALAWLLYHGGHWQPSRGLQHGELLQPLQPLVVSTLSSADGLPFDGAQLRGRWTLLYHSSNRCADDCQQLLMTLQHVRLAQGQAMTHVQRVLVLSAPPGDEEARQLRGSGNDLRVVTAASWPLASGSVYLLDPQGNLVLRYRPGFEPRGLLQDLQRLLRLSGAT